MTYIYIRGFSAFPHPHFGCLNPQQKNPHPNLQVTLGPLGLLETLLAHPEAFLGEWQNGDHVTQIIGQPQI